MATIWIQGKPVMTADEDELMRLLPLADTSAPGLKGGSSRRPRLVVPEARTRDIRESGQDQSKGLAGEFENLERPQKQFLAFLAKSKRATGEAVKKELNLEARELAGIVSSLTKRFGRGKVVRVTIDRKGKARQYWYSLTGRAATVSRAEKWTA